MLFWPLWSLNCCAAHNLQISMVQIITFGGHKTAIPLNLCPSVFHEQLESLQHWRWRKSLLTFLLVFFKGLPQHLLPLLLVALAYRRVGGGFHGGQFGGEILNIA